MKKYILIPILLLFCLAIANADVCKQPYPQQSLCSSGTCNMSYTGISNQTGQTDVCCLGFQCGSGYYNHNYTLTFIKPSDSISASWSNLSIPDSCFDETNLVLKFYQHGECSPGADITCYNGSEYIDVGTTSDIYPIDACYDNNAVFWEQGTPTDYMIDVRMIASNSSIFSRFNTFSLGNTYDIYNSESLIGSGTYLSGIVYNFKDINIYDGNSLLMTNRTDMIVPDNIIIQVNITNETYVPYILFSDNIEQQPFNLTNQTEQNNSGVIEINSSLPSQDQTYPYIFYWNVTVKTGNIPSSLLISIDGVLVGSATLQQSCTNLIPITFYLSNGGHTLSAVVEASNYGTSISVSASNSSLLFDQQYIIIGTLTCTDGEGNYTGNGTISSIERSDSAVLDFWFALMPNAWDGLIILMVIFAGIGIWLSIATQQWTALPVSIGISFIFGIVIFGYDLFGSISPIAIPTFVFATALLIVWLLYSQFKTSGTG
jgi:hypothetical protein